MLQPPSLSRVRITPGDGARGQADRGGVRGDVLQDDRPGADAGSLADCDGTEHRCADTDDGVALNRRVALAALFPRAAEGDALVHGDIVPDRGGLTNDDTHTVIDEDALTDPGTGVNLDAGDEPT